jgi:myo-inositol-1(or 4)-monophosphatase
MHPMLTIAVKAARRAGNIINRASLNLEQLHIETKRPLDFVTQVDRAAEEAIIDIIRDAYPDHDILAEESGHVSEENRMSEYCWIIDPLDGTTNFIHGFPQYAVSIALSYRENIVISVIYDPTRDELFTAEKGGGAFLNNKRIRVSKRHALKDSLITTGFPFRDLPTLDAFLSVLRRVTSQAAAVRRPGAASLDLAYLACGRVDGYFEFDLSPWDIAAGCLIAKEAGALVTDTDGESDYLNTGNIVAATPKVFPALLAAVQSEG